jgi:hypothetical protein
MAGERQAGAEPLVTERSRPYDESTLRKRARELAQHGGVDIIARAVEASVEQAVAERALQDEVVRLPDEQAPKLRDRRLHVRVGDPGDPAGVLDAVEAAGALRV